jgi:hypothetical protein
MNGPALTQPNMELSASDATAEDIDQMTRQLPFELRKLDVESSELTKGGVTTAGTKSNPISLGSIALELLPSDLPSVIGLMQAWICRRQRRTGKFKRMGIEFEGSPESLHKFLETLSKEKQQ